MTCPAGGHEWAVAAAWPSGPDGETDTLQVCRRCPAVSIHADEDDEEEGGQG